MRILRKRSLRAALVMGLILCAQVAIAQQSDESGESRIDQGRDIAFGRADGNCLACHQIEGGDLAGNIGPPLVQMKARFPDRQKLFERIWDEAKINPMTVMPPFGRNKILDKQQIEKVVDFLYTL